MQPNYCQYEQQPTDKGERWVCSECGHVSRRLYPTAPVRICDKHRTPGIAQKVVGYSVAVARWMAAGKPVRSDEETARLYEICESNVCGFFRNGDCGVCGCKVSRDGEAPLIKNRMATESCPAGKW